MARAHAGVGRRPGRAGRALSALAGAALAALVASCRAEPAGAPPEATAAPRATQLERLAADVARLASPALRGRRAGTPGGALAADHVAAAFREAGLAPVPGAGDLRLGFTAPTWRWGRPPALELGGVVARLGADFELLEGSASGAVEGALAFAGYGVALPAFDPSRFPACPLPSGWDDFGPIDLRGRVAVVVSGLPGGAPLVPGACPDRAGCGGAGEPACHGASDKAAQALARGAAAVLFVPRSTTAPAPRPFASVQAGLPVLWVGHEAVAAALPSLPAWIAAVDGLTPAPALAEVRARVAVDGGPADAALANVVGVIPGADPVLGQEVVVVGAHLDHLGEAPFRDAWYPGADDNASGVAALLEVARLLAAGPVPPARTLVLAAWDGEEPGLLGSRRWVAAPPLPLAATVAAFSIDMVGAGAPGLQVAGAGGEGDRRLFEAAEPAATALGLGPLRWWPGPVLATDHAPFAAAGVPAAWLSTPGPHPDYHRTADTADRVDPARLAEVVRLVLAVLEPWAQGTEPRPTPSLRRPAVVAVAGAPHLASAPHASLEASP